ncbi:uncharacterized protein BXZ73DRAFT_20153, partial [Epithele typhae]|uniref:uncharacterized protein n=1 Tax=Epithele typhae TaxID=378194 RepID=UPI00200735C0
DYVPDIKSLLDQTVDGVYCYLYTTNAFPNRHDLQRTVVGAWQAVCASHRTLAPEAPVYALDERMVRAVRHPIVATYDLGAPGRPPMRDRFAESAIVFDAIRAFFFDRAETSIAFRFPTQFNPMPNAVIALVMTVIRGHIAEWATGKRVNDKFKAESDTGTVGHTHHYRGFLEDLKQFGDANPQAWLNIRTRMYSKAFRAGGGAELDTSTARVSRATMESATSQLEGRMGLTDSEPE